MIQLSQADGRKLELKGPAKRVVSLVPCITETLLLFGKTPVGRTSFCIEPEAKVSKIPVVGGTKTPLLDRIFSLQPDLVIANQEENRKEDVEEMSRKGLQVWVTYPQRVADVPPFLLELAQVSGCQGQAESYVQECKEALKEGQPPDKRVSVIALIWKDPWMAVGRETYSNDLMEVAGGVNPLVSRESRYPTVTENEVVHARPDLLILPSEPYHFTESDREEWASKLGSKSEVVLFSGEDLSWFGPRMVQGLRSLREIAGSRRASHLES